MPSDLTVKALKSVNPKIDLGEIDLLMALYCGGKRFQKFKPEFLIHREAENLGLADIDDRLKRAQYVNISAGLINGIVAQATVGDPKIVGNDPYWEELNANSDGQGTPFSSLARMLVSDMLVARFPYVEARSIDNDPYTIWRRDPETVYDFQNTDSGDLEWIKTVAKQQERTAAYAAPDKIKVVTTYYTADSTTSYVYYENQDGTPVAADGSFLTDDSVVSPDASLSVSGHDYGEVPIYRGNATKTHWVMDRISEAIKAIYNTEVDLSFSLANCAYAQLVLNLESAQRAGQLVRHETGAWILVGQEKASYLTPPNSAFDGLFKNIDRLKRSLNESLNMMAHETASIPQAGRLSGDAVREHRKPMDSLIGALTWPVEDMLNRCLARIAEINGYDVPMVVGLGDGPDLNVDSLVEGISNDGREQGRSEDGRDASAEEARAAGVASEA